MEKKVEEYRQKLNVDLSKVINEEKEKEAKRTKQLDEEKDPEEKKKIEKQISNERAQSTQKITEMSK
jgi:hypothetical protein